MPFESKGDEPLSEIFNFRLTGSEKIRLKEDADIAGLSMSEILRRRYFGRPVIQNNSMSIIKELRRIGSLLRILSGSETYAEPSSEAFLQLKQVLEEVSNHDREGG